MLPEISHGKSPDTTPVVLRNVYTDESLELLSIRVAVVLGEFGMLSSLDSLRHEIRAKNEIRTSGISRVVPGFFMGEM